MLASRLVLAIATTASMLMLAAFDTAEAIWPIKKIQKSVPTLTIIPGTTLGNMMLGKIGTEMVGIARYPNVPLDTLRKGTVLANEAHQLFLKTCAKYKAKDTTEQVAMDSIGCPSGRRIEGDNIYYVLKVAGYPGKSSSIFSAKAAARLKDSATRNKVLGQLILAHRMAYKLDWYLSWEESDVMLTNEGNVFISPHSFVMDTNFALIPDDGKYYHRELHLKLGYISDMMYEFLRLFFAKYTFPGENVHALINAFVAQLPGRLRTMKPRSFGAAAA
ncbi:hypothetical protein SYNPS1DRAFT_26714 [Syncephalis pseudoplumigaleata]|uniref:Uncharacterized protein n=1 Tax=Syncephalis pseudoplumigaleata TaxID=1712513 RepID=A0A4P9Z5B9_9FUNG|nr:hypothetical protein SYNPS1DRAFT_26714 [Syncephalis pseudoplumigaleata]|eukprot:RKP27648.1 hypothetical protein SYNPS1DRAFT_26714 [Syncephalis pseudoplumigaleata]